MTVHRPAGAAPAPAAPAFAFALALALLPSIAAGAQAHKLRVQGMAVAVAGSALTVTPPRDWNSLSRTIGKSTETWTLDGEQLNDITFFGGIAAGRPLVREPNRKQAPLPKFTGSTLLVEIAELLERTYRTSRNSGSFELLSNRPGRFLGRDGVVFTYAFTDQDQLGRKGEGRAAIIDGKLYMITYEAPALHFFDRSVDQFRSIADSATL